MPIYAYRCSSCGHQQDVLQKFSDAPLVVCPACGLSTFAKQLSAPAFQLKGTGWYVTDFRDNKKPGQDKAADGDRAGGDGADAASGGKAADKPAEKGKEAGGDSSAGKAGDKGAVAPAGGSKAGAASGGSGGAPSAPPPSSGAAKPGSAS